MSNDLNQCQFIGRLGKDPELRYMPNGDAVANFSIACGSKWKDKQSGEQQERTEWIRVTAFKKLAEIIGEYLKKGSQVYVSGKMRTRTYEKEGQTHYATEIIADTLQMLGGRSQNGNERTQAGNEPTKAEAGFDDDIPF
jgi:single-strand DNA-binding protein